MIRTKMMMLAFGVLSLSGVSAMAATKTTHHQAKTSVVAQAEGGDAAKPADEGKKAKKAKGSKKSKAASGETAPAPAPETK